MVTGVCGILVEVFWVAGTGNIFYYAKIRFLDTMQETKLRIKLTRNLGIQQQKNLKILNLYKTDHTYIKFNGTCFGHC